jgi:hypothetical protein
MSGWSTDSTPPKEETLNSIQTQPTVLLVTPDSKTPASYIYQIRNFVLKIFTSPITGGTR